MDADRFDTLTRSLTTPGSRRRALAALSGALGVALAVSGVDEAGAKKKKKPCPPCKKRKKGKCKKLPDGTGCNGGTCQSGSCVGAAAGPTLTQRCVPNCGDRTCGDDGCGGSCGPGAWCSGTCVDTTTNKNHCGGCGEACETDEFCHQSQCVRGPVTCPVGTAGKIDCGTDRPQCGVDCFCFNRAENELDSRCGQVGVIVTDQPCFFDSQCETQYPGLTGVFCAQLCGLGPGTGVCMAPCPS